MKYAYVYPTRKMVEILSEQCGYAVSPGDRVTVHDIFIGDMWEFCGKFYKLPDHHRMDQSNATLEGENDYWNFHNTWFEVVEMPDVVTQGRDTFYVDYTPSVTTPSYVWGR